MNLGLVLKHLGHVEQGFNLLIKAKRGFARSGDLRNAADAASNLAAIAMSEAAHKENEDRRDSYKLALESLEEAISWYERFRSSFWEYASRMSFTEDHIHCYRSAVTCCLNLGNLQAALAYHERSKAKLLADCIELPPVPEASDVGGELH